MKARKTLSRLAAMFMAVMLLAALAIVPAGATDGVIGGTSGTPITTLTITKELTAPANVVTSEDAEFTFTLAGTAANSGETHTSGGTTFDVKSGSGSVTQTVKFDAGSKDGDTVNVSFNLNGFNFTDPGVYKYTITETISDEDFTDVTESLVVYLFVESTTDGCQIYAAEVVGANGGKTDTWENSYLADANGSLTVEKKIEGTMASENDEFTFTVSGLTSGRTYVVKYSNKEVTESRVANNGSISFELKGGESFTIYGLEDGTYTVVEADDNKGYTLASMTNDNDSDTDGAQVVITSGSNATTTFTNTRNAVSPTGIITTFAPYALMVVVAAGACFFFLRRRNAAED